MRKPARLLVLAALLAAGACSSLNQPGSTFTPFPEEVGPTPTPVPTPTPRPSPLRNARVVGFFDLSNSSGDNTMTPWLSFATNSLSFSGGNIAIRRQADATAEPEFGLVFGQDVEREYLDLRTITAPEDISSLPTTGWMQALDFNLIAPNRYYALRLPTANVAFAVNPLSEREATIDYVYQPVDRSNPSSDPFR